MEKYRAERPLMSDSDLNSHDEDDEYEFETRNLQQRNTRLKHMLLIAFIALPWILLVVLGLISRYFLNQCKMRYYIRPDLIYSTYTQSTAYCKCSHHTAGPLQDLVRYETKIFTTGLPSDTDYSAYAAEPSEEVDELWKDLYPSTFQYTLVLGK